MIIKSSCKECVDLIVGICGSSSFYEKFDKPLNENHSNITIVDLQNPKKLEELFELVRKIRSHWNKIDDSIFKNFIREHLSSFHDFLNDSKGHYRQLICSTQDINNGLQNTKISKFLYMLAPDFIPMIDQRQGNFLVYKYNNNSRSKLVAAIQVFHKHFACNSRRINQIQSVLLNDYNILLSQLRAFELLLWLHVNLDEKGIEKKIFQKEK